MPLSTEPKSIQTAVTLKHYKEFCAALNVPAAGQAAAVTGFRQQFNSLLLKDNEEKEWVQTVTLMLASSKEKNASDSLIRSVALRKELPNVIWTRVREVITSLGRHGMEWMKEFGPNPNLADLKKIAGIVGQEQAVWTQSIPPQSKKPDLVAKALAGLTAAKFTQEEIVGLWDHFKGVKTDVLWALVEDTPAELYKANQHLKTAGLQGGFWMTGKNAVKNQEAIKPVSAIVYKDATWSAKPSEVNQMAARLVTAIAASTTGTPAWMNLFTITQLFDIQDRLKAVPAFQMLFFPKAGSLAASRKLENDPEFGKWLTKYCDLVAKMAGSGYSDAAILAMFDHKFNKKLIIQCTWFSRIELPMSTDREVFFKVNGVNGGVIGRRNHLARRHLYAHFDFDDIKALNSFHSPATSVEQMVGLANAMVLPDRNPGVKTMGGYCVVVGEGWTNQGGRRREEPEKRLVISLYPNLMNSHQDHYTKDEMERIKKVLSWIPPGTGKSLSNS